MFEKLSEKDQKTLKMGVLAALALIVAFTVYQGYNYWETKKKVQKDLDRDFKSPEHE